MPAAADMASTWRSPRPKRKTATMALAESNRAQSLTLDRCRRASDASASRYRSRAAGLPVQAAACSSSTHAKTAFRKSIASPRRERDASWQSVLLDRRSSGRRYGAIPKKQQTAGRRARGFCEKKGQKRPSETELTTCGVLSRKRWTRCLGMSPSGETADPQCVGNSQKHQSLSTPNSGLVAA